MVKRGNIIKKIVNFFSRNKLIILLIIVIIIAIISKNKNKNNNEIRENLLIGGKDYNIKTITKVGDKYQIKIGVSNQACEFTLNCTPTINDQFVCDVKNIKLQVGTRPEDKCNSLVAGLKQQSGKIVLTSDLMSDSGLNEKSGVTIGKGNCVINLKDIVIDDRRGEVTQTIPIPKIQKLLGGWDKCEKIKFISGNEFDVIPGDAISSIDENSGQIDFSQRSGTDITPLALPGGVKIQDGPPVNCELTFSTVDSDFDANTGKWEGASNSASDQYGYKSKWEAKITQPQRGAGTDCEVALKGFDKKKITSQAAENWPTDRQNLNDVVYIGYILPASASEASAKASAL